MHINILFNLADFMRSLKCFKTTSQVFKYSNSFRNDTKLNKRKSFMPVLNIKTSSKTLRL